MSSRKLKPVKEEAVVNPKEVKAKESKPKEVKPKRSTKKSSDKKEEVEMELVLEKDIHSGVSDLYPEIEKLEDDLLKLNIKKSLSGLKNE